MCFQPGKAHGFGFRVSLRAVSSLQMTINFWLEHMATTADIHISTGCLCPPCDTIWVNEKTHAPIRGLGFPLGMSFCVHHLGSVKKSAPIRDYTWTRFFLGFPLQWSFFLLLPVLS